ncbi:DUF6702 family protein [Shewanella donghaensis]|uniref:DUF6702 family protein n=1 Tax=Shewanella donghaensis TaxID=238836 RepID=UPI001182BC49|nr:DUF6702 family protein [Shewanella donghaensis]
MSWSMTTLLWITALAGLLVFNFNASAHQQKESYSNVLFNARSGNLEIQHRFYLHDAEHAAKRILDSHADLNKDPVSREAFAYYVMGNFKIADNNQQLLPLEYVGTEVEGKYLWVYQETQLPRSIEVKDSSSDRLAGFYIKMESLQELWPSQLNYINVEREKEVKSLRLSAGDAWQYLPLTEALN